MFLILSGVILAAGVLYWFWSHIQLTQKKVQLLENAVFELRGMLAPSEIHPEPEPTPSQSQSQYRDLDDDDWVDRTDRTDQDQIRVAVVEASAGSEQTSDARAEAPQTVQVIREAPVKMTPELIQGFTSLYAESETKTVEAKTDEPQTLEGMTIKELRRMASERGITGTAEMRKKELVSALRESVPAPPGALIETELTLDA